MKLCTGEGRLDASLPTWHGYCPSCDGGGTAVADLEAGVCILEVPIP